MKVVGPGHAVRLRGAVSLPHLRFDLRDVPNRRDHAIGERDRVDAAVTAKPSGLFGYSAPASGGVKSNGVTRNVAG